MTIMEIALLVIGVIIFVMSFLLPDVKEEKSEKDLAAEKDEVHRLVEQEIDSMKLKVNEATNDTVEYAVERAERSLEKVSNEKIMAVNEYAGTIIEEINKNHKEVMFLYDMLRDKQSDLSNAVRQADAKVKEIETISHSAQEASETLLRGMSVASVSQKGLTAEQKSVFDDIVIPEAEPVIFEKHEQFVAPAQPVAVEKPMAKPKGAALAQSKILAGLTGKTVEEVIREENNNTQKAGNASTASTVQDENQTSQTVALREHASENTAGYVREKSVVYDVISGSAYKNGNVVGVDIPAAGVVSAADYTAMVKAARERSDALIAKKQEQAMVTASGAPVTQAPANNNDVIIEMSKQGLTTVEIARALNLGVGEVKLVLDLFR